MAARAGTEVGRVEIVRFGRPAIVGATLLLTLSCVASVACGPDGGDPGDDEASDRRHPDDPAGDDVDPPEDRTTTTVAPDEPSAAEPDQVVPYLEDLLAGYDAAVNDIVADPSIAEDPGHPTVEEFLGLFEAGSEFAAGSLEGWAAQAERGTTLRPASPERGVNTTSLEGPPGRIDDDTILFGHCTVQSYVVVVDGEATRRQERKVLPGTGRAVRVDGRWRLRDITTPPDAGGCLTQGGVVGGGP